MRNRPKASPRGSPDVSGEILARGELRFVIEREEGEIRGYREGLGPGALSSLDRSRWQPQRQLDLHRARVAEIERVVLPFLRDAADSGLRRVLLIHGKGLHSPGGIGVLRDELVTVLTAPSSAQIVRAFRTAPLRLGGSGALLVELG